MEYSITSNFYTLKPFNNNKDIGPNKYNFVRKHKNIQLEVSMLWFGFVVLSRSSNNMSLNTTMFARQTVAFQILSAPKQPSIRCQIVPLCQPSSVLQICHQLKKGTFFTSFSTSVLIYEISYVAFQWDDRNEHQQSWLFLLKVFISPILC